MTTTIVNMTKKEFTEIIAKVVEQKLFEILGDPENGEILKENVRKRLIRQKKSAAAGERGEDIHHVITRLGLQWLPCIPFDC